MTEEPNKVMGSLNKILQFLMGEDYTESMKELSRGYVSAKLEEFQNENIPDKGPTLDNVRRTTADVQAAIKECEVTDDKPNYHWAETFLETMDADLPPYIFLLKNYRGPGYIKLQWSAKQLEMIYIRAADIREPKRSRWTRAVAKEIDLNPVAVNMMLALRPHLNSIAREISQYGK